VVVCPIHFHDACKLRPYPTLGTRLQTVPYLTERAIGVSGQTEVSLFQFLQYRLSIWSSVVIVCASSDKHVRRKVLIFIKHIDNELEKENRRFLMNYFTRLG
jgi:hypothetical protein